MTAKKGEGCVVESGAFASAMAELARIVMSKPTIPVLDHVLIEPAETGAEAGAETGDAAPALRLTATDLDLQCSLTVPIVAGAAIHCTTQARRLSALLGALPKGSQVTLRHDGGSLALVSGKVRTRLPTLSPSDFPQMRRQEGGAAFSLAIGELRRVLGLVSFAITDPDDKRYYLHGINLAVRGGDAGSEARFAATNGYRLAVAAICAPEGAEALDGRRDIILPEKLVGVLRGLDESGEIAVAIAPGAQIVIDYPSGRHIVAKLIDGEFPDYDRIIPPENPDRRLSVGRVAIADALGRVRLLMDDKERRTELRLTDGALTLCGRGSDGAEISEELDAQWTGEPAAIFFNGGYLRDQIDALSGDRMVMDRIGDGDETRHLLRDEAAGATFVLCGLKF